MNALLMQLGISGPLVFAVMVYTATRREPGLVQRYLLALLGLILAWMIGMVAHASPDAQVRAIGDLLAYPPAAFMSPYFCVLMLLYARVEVFEKSRGARAAVLAPFWFFLVVFLTDDWHGQMGGGMALIDGGSAETSPGPLFWSFQVCTNATALVGLAVTASIVRSSPSPEERYRMGLLCGGAFLPLMVHAAFTFDLLPISYPLTPLALGITALMLVAALRRYGLLEVQPVARRDVIEASRDAVIIGEVQERVVDLNPMAALLLDAPRDTLTGQPLEAVLNSLGPTLPADAVTRLLESVRCGETPPVSEFEDAQGRILEASAGQARSTSGATAGYFVVLRDRTGERRAERLLQRSQRLESVGILAAGVAHEVNNPLAFLRSNLAHLAQVAVVLDASESELPEKVAEQTQDLAEVIDESITGLERIETIVRGLLGLSRTASERVDACDANTIVSEAARFASLDGTASVRLESRLAESLPRIIASSDQLVQVLLNLFLNAKHALQGRPDSLIVASTRACDEWIEIRIADNGPGIPEEIRGKIFDPFFTTRAPNEGTGLGLPIACDIVRDHGGTLELEASERGGACFVVRLPVSDAR